MADKVSLINDLMANLEVSLFNNNSSKSDIFSNYFIPIWRKNAKNVFTEFELYDLAFEPSADPVGNVTAPPELPGGIANCFCHVGESGFSCRKVSVGFPSGITITNGVCQLVGDCTYSHPGCGWFWLSSCSGNHCNFG